MSEISHLCGCEELESQQNQHVAETVVRNDFLTLLRHYCAAKCKQEQYGNFA